MPKQWHTKVIVDSLAVTKHWLNRSKKAVGFRQKSLFSKGWISIIEASAQRWQNFKTFILQLTTTYHLHWYFPSMWSLKIFCNLFRNYLYTMPLLDTGTLVPFFSLGTAIGSCMTKKRDLAEWSKGTTCAVCMRANAHAEHKCIYFFLRIKLDITIKPQVDVCKIQNEPKLWKGKGSWVLYTYCDFNSNCIASSACTVSSPSVWGHILYYF